jgi:hypothetical protein
MAMSPDWMVWFGSFGVETLFVAVCCWFGFVGFALLCAGIRALLSCFVRCLCTFAFSLASAL